MTSPQLTFFSVALALLGMLAPASSRAAPPWKDFGWLESPHGLVRVEAALLTARDGGRQVLLSGGVHLTGENLDVRADRVEIFTDRSSVLFVGGVRVIENNRVLLCERLELDRQAAEAILQNATILVKEQTSLEVLTRCQTASALARAGFNLIEIQGEKFVRQGSGYQVEGARFTPCDCREGKPSWELRASSADLIPGQRAWLMWPVLYLKGIPVFALPVAYLPLSERRTGLLFPRFNYSGRDGVVLSESLFIRLGRSADTTLSLDWFEARGFRERLEVRAVPAQNAKVEASFTHISDRKVANLHERYNGDLDARVDGPSGLSASTSVRLFSDSDINRDFVSDMAGRATDEAVSSMVLARRGTDTLLAFDAAYHQDLRSPAVNLFGAAANDTIHRLGAFSFHWVPPYTSTWPVVPGLILDLANLSSLGAAWRDWGFDGTPQPLGTTAPDAGEGDLQLSDGELRRALRLLVEPQLLFPFRLGRFLDLQVELSHRQLAYLSHGPQAPDPSTRGISFASLSLETELARAFGAGEDRIGHVIAPWLKLAAAWPGLSSGGPRAYLDLQDRLMQQAAQLLAGFDTALYRFDQSSGWSNIFRLMLCQAVDLRAPRLAQLGSELSLVLPPMTGSWVLGYDWNSLSIGEVDLSLEFADSRGDSARATYLYLPSVPDPQGRPLPLAERMQREEGLMFGLDPAPFRSTGDSVHVLELTTAVNVGAGVVLNAGINLDLYATQVNWYGGGLSYRSDCRCWNASVTARMLRGQAYPDVFFLLDLAYLGSAGGGTSTRF